MSHKRITIAGLTFLRDECQSEDVMVDVYRASIGVEKRPNLEIKFKLIDVSPDGDEGKHYWEMQAEIGNKGNISVTESNGKRTDIPAVEDQPKNHIPMEDLRRMVVAFLISAYLITNLELEECRGKCA